MNRKHPALFALILVSMPRVLAAHEGHGVEATWGGIAHWLSSPFHIALTVTVVLIAVVAAFAVRSAIQSAQELDRDDLQAGAGT